MKLKLERALVCFISSFLMVTGSIFGTNHWDTPEKYTARVDSLTLFSNTMETAVPQTEVYNLIRNHLASPSADGREKKVLVLGYDGTRVDTLTTIDPANSAITKLSENGYGVISYCGGVNYPRMNTQATSTAPGWCSMLTGTWADVHGVRRNMQPKSNDHLTLLTTAVQDGIADSSAFYISWKGHFSNRLMTYYPEKQYVEKEGLPVRFVQADDDEGTLANVKNDLAQKDCTDFIFFIMEYVDHVGHSSGFDVKNKKYVNAFHTADEKALDILNTLEARETYEQEDWLILITTDHGGCNLNHGRCTIQERYTFMFCNKPILPPQEEPFIIFGAPNR